MGELPPGVQLVDFTRDGSLKTLRGWLAAWGLEIIERSARSWLADANAVPWPSALWLGRKSAPEARMLCQPMRAGLCRLTLAVFERSLADDDCQLCGRCSDFIRWPATEDELRLRLMRLWAGRTTTPHSKESPVVGQGRLMESVRALTAKFAACDVPALIRGETGTGKELAARAIHYQSARRDHPFIPVNCGAIPSDLIENELFGHQRGAYTDAVSGQPGLVEQADRGTLFLDEIGTLSQRAQCALLRFLQEREYRRLGSGQTRQADVRVVAATNADLERLVAGGEFRADLFYRLNILALQLPPLRQRLEDLPELVEHLLRQFRASHAQPDKRLGPEVMGWLAAQSWPGNVRELENTLLRAFLVSEGECVTLGSFLPAADAEPPAPAPDFRAAKAEIIASFERDYLAQLLRRTAGNVTRAARLAGKERRALGKLLKKHGLSPSDYS
jgi:DNA-binding NtrC family response regulator